MKFVLSYLMKYKKSVVLSMFIKVLSTFFELFIPFVFEYMLDKIVPRRSISHILLCGIFLLFLVFATRWASIKGNKGAVKNASVAIYDLREALFKKILSLDGEDLNNFSSSSLISRMTEDQYNIQSFMQTFQTLLSRAPVLLLGGVLMTFLLDRTLALLLLSILPLIIIIVILISKKGVLLFKDSQMEGDLLTEKMRENISGTRVIRAFSKEEYEKNKFKTLNTSYFKKNVRASIFTSLPVPLVTLCMNIGLCLVVLFSAFRIKDGKMESGEILAFLTYFQMILTGLTGINRIIVVSSKALSSSIRIEEVLKTETKILKENREDKNATAFIVFDNVSFTYEKNSDKYALRNVSFTLNKGESLGIIGPTGCGKSTILNLLLRFYDVDEGSIYIDGENIKTYTKKELRKKFSVVQQSDSLFSGSVEENVSFKRNLNKEEVEDGIECACAGEFAYSFKEGLSHEIALKGEDLSGGQKERLLLSRALAKKSEILVLDDVTSALDYETERKVRLNIQQHNAESALIVIGERVSSVKSCDKILFLEDGRALYYSTHDELLKNSKEYRELFNEQMGDLHG